MGSDFLANFFGMNVLVDVVDLRRGNEMMMLAVGRTGGNILEGNRELAFAPQSHTATLRSKP